MKKVVSVFLSALIMVFTCMVPASAASSKVTAPNIFSAVPKSSTSVVLTLGTYSPKTLIYYSTEKKGEYELYGQTSKYEITVKNLKPAATYYFRAKGQDKIDGKTVTSSYSSAVKCTTFASANQLAAPSKVSLVSKTDSSLKIEWDDCKGAELYSVYYGTDKNYMSLYGNTDKNSVTIKNLIPATQYYVRLQSVSTDDGKTVRSEYSSYFVLKTANISIAAPKNIKGSDITENSLNVSWDYAANAYEYEVYYSKSVDSGYQLYSTTSSNYISIYGLAENTTYYIKVRGKTYDYQNNKEITGSFSQILKATTKKTQAPPASSGGSSGDDDSSSGSGSSGNTTTYILNTNTKKFHYTYCSSVKKMSEKNKRTFTGTRDEVIKMGYSPCGNCHP